VHFYKELFRFYVLLPFILVCTAWCLKARASDKELNKSEPRRVAGDFVVVDDDDADTKKRTLTSAKGNSPTKFRGGDTNCNEQHTRHVPNTSKDTVNYRESAQSGTDFVIINEKPPTFNDRAVHQISKAVRKIRTFNPSKFKRKQVIATASTHGLLALVNTWALFLFFVSTSCTNGVRPYRYTERPSIAELYEMQYLSTTYEEKRTTFPN